jgi:hypothetical protein
MKSLVQQIIENYMGTNLNIKVNEEDDPLKAYYEKYGEKWNDTHDLDNEIEELLDKSRKTSDIGLADAWVVTDDQVVPPNSYYIIKLHGGLNGSGNWRNYLKDIQGIISHFDKLNPDHTRGAYIIKLDVDVPDDVWTLYLGIHK